MVAQAIELRARPWTQEEIEIFGEAYKGRRVLVTGHTGFKGSWLALWLERLGASVHGYALAPSTHPSHFERLGLDMRSVLADVRDGEALASALNEARPEVVFHLAAQPIVLDSYADPLATLATNVMGTANVLDACRRVSSVRAVVVVTTDKCYENREWDWGYREDEPLGGHDPYSASKACAELVTSSLRRSFFHESGSALVASARAGNVIGGGDWSPHRLVPDVMRAAAAGDVVGIRNPQSSRPWQHVLEPLAGYLALGAGLLGGRRELAEAWNFGPDLSGNLTTGELCERMAPSWSAIRCELAKVEGAPHEAGLLMLDSTKARRRLGWRPVWDVDTTLERTVEWYRAFYESKRLVTAEQITAYCEDAVESGVSWATA